MLCLHHRMRSFGVTTGVDVVRLTLPVNMSMPGVGQKVNDFLFNAKDAVRVERKLQKVNIRTGKALTQRELFPHVYGRRITTPTSKDYCGWHPTTKNLEIMERIIRAYTLEGDTVLDIFMGSGSTAIAAKRAGRKYIGCERDSEYYDKLQQRLESERNVLDFAS